MKFQVSLPSEVHRFGKVITLPLETDHPIHTLFFVGDCIVSDTPPHQWLVLTTILTNADTRHGYTDWEVRYKDPNLQTLSFTYYVNGFTKGQYNESYSNGFLLKHRPFRNWIKYYWALITKRYNP